MKIEAPCACRDYEWFTRAEADGSYQYRNSIQISRAVALIAAGEEVCRVGTYPLGYHRIHCQERASLQLHSIACGLRSHEARGDHIVTGHLIDVAQ
jgi:hypothetical protein